MGTYYTGIVYGIDNIAVEDFDFWRTVYEGFPLEFPEVGKRLTTSRNSSELFYGFAIAYDDGYVAEIDSAELLQERIITTPNLETYVTQNFF